MHRHEHISRVAGAALTLTFAVLALQIVFSAITGSLALISDTVHVLGHLLVLGFNYLAQKVAGYVDRKNGDALDEAYHDIELWAHLVSGIVLLSTVPFLCFEALARVAEPHSITPAVALYGLIGLLFNLATLLILREEKAHPSIRGPIAHVVTDSISSVGVVLAGVLIWLTGRSIFDTLISVAIILLIVVWGIDLMVKSRAMFQEKRGTHSSKHTH